MATPIVTIRSRQLVKDESPPVIIKQAHDEPVAPIITATPLVLASLPAWMPPMRATATVLSSHRQGVSPEAVLYDHQRYSERTPG